MNDAETVSKDANSFTNWYIVTEQIYTIYHSFLSYSSSVNRLTARDPKNKVLDAQTGAMGDLFKLYHLSMSSGAFPPKIADDDKRKILRIATGNNLPSREDINWACNKITEWYTQSGFLNIKIPPKKKYDGSNAMAEGYGTRYG